MCTDYNEKGIDFIRRFLQTGIWTVPGIITTWTYYIFSSHKSRVDFIEERFRDKGNVIVTLS